MTENDTNIDVNIEENDKTGNVKVRVEAQRGTGTNDRDKVKVTGWYDHIEEAEDESDRLTMIARNRLREARMIDEDGEVEVPETEIPDGGEQHSEDELEDFNDFNVDR